MNFVKTFFIDGWMGPKFIRDNRLSSKTLKTLSVSHLPQEPFLLYLRMAGNLTLTCSSDFYWDNHDTLTRNFFIVSPLLSTFWLTKTLIRRFEFNSIMRFLNFFGEAPIKKMGKHWLWALLIFVWMVLVVFSASMGSANLKIDFFKRIWEIQLTCNEANQEPGGIFLWFILDTWNVFKD